MKRVMPIYNNLYRERNLNMSDYDDDDFFPDDDLDIDLDAVDKIFYDEDQHAWFACERDGTTIEESKCDTEDEAIDFWWDNVYDPDIDGPDDDDEDNQDNQEPDNSEDNSEDNDE